MAPDCARKVFSTTMLLALAAGLIFSSGTAQAEIALKIKEAANVARSGEIVHNGIPIGRTMNLLTTAGLQMRTATGTPVPAQFEVLSRWGGGRASNQPIQWLMVSYPATVAAGGSATYTLNTGVNPAPASPLSITQTATDITVNTGAASFTLGKTSFSVLKKAILKSGSNQVTLINSQAGQARVNVSGVGWMTALPPEEIAIEHQGPLWVTVKVAGHFDHPPTGGAALRYVARYSFRSGSPSFLLDYYFAWPGSKNGETINSVSDAWVGGTADPRDACILVNKAELLLPTALTAAYTGYAGLDATKSLTGAITASTTVSLTQCRRPTMTSPARSAIRLGNSLTSGGLATLPFVAVRGAGGGLGASIHQMRFYEPQALVATPGALRLDVVAEPQWLAPFMGTYAKMEITLLQAGDNLAQRRTQVCTELDHGLIAWPDQATVAGSQAFGELWDGSSKAIATSFMGILNTLSQYTLSHYVSYGMHGLMTYGLVPRYWDSSWQEFGDETDRWDGYFFHGVFTDYHHTFASVARQFAVTGDAELLYGLAFPAARRMLNTQIVQVNPGNPDLCGGWAPLGYGAYRTDDNSSHSYFENLFFYYYLTGDRQALDTLLIAGRHKRPYYTRAADGSLLPPSEPTPGGEWFGSGGRVASQTANIFWFLGHASEDGGFLDDFINLHERYVARHTALLKKNGKEYAFAAEADIGANPHSMESEQFWMMAQYNLNDIWKIYQDFGDRALGPDRVRISRLFKAHYNTLWDYASKIHPGGDGSAAGTWANYVNLTWTGGLIGGSLTTITPATQGETYLYDTGKGCLPALAFRAALLNGNDATMRAKGEEMFHFLYDSYDTTGKPWDKQTGLQLFLSHAGLAYVANPGIWHSNAADGAWMRME